MAETRRCTNCGSPLEAGSLLDQCHRCVARWTLSEKDPEEMEYARSGSSFEPPEPEELRALFPDLEIQKFVGRGGMGAVYKAYEERCDRELAVKILDPRLGEDPVFAARFLREGRTLGQLSHPSIVRVHDVGQTNGLFYLTMEYVEGRSLRKLIQEKNVTPTQAVSIVRQICSALEYLHGEGIVHRDIKPENILADDEGQVKVADFGLAKLLEESSPDEHLTEPNETFWTVAYLAPEQVKGSSKADPRADIYALGVVLYEMLTGVLPMGHFVPASAKAAVTKAVDGVVLKALRQQPQDRYQTAGEFQEALRNLENLELIEEPAWEPPTGKLEREFRHWTLLALAAWGTWVTSLLLPVLRGLNQGEILITRTSTEKLTIGVSLFLVTYACAGWLYGLNRSYGVMKLLRSEAMQWRLILGFCGSAALWILGVQFFEWIDPNRGHSLAVLAGALLFPAVVLVVPWWSIHREVKLPVFDRLSQVWLGAALVILGVGYLVTDQSVIGGIVLQLAGGALFVFALRWRLEADNPQSSVAMAVLFWSLGLLSAFLLTLEWSSDLHADIRHFVYLALVPALVLMVLLGRLRLAPKGVVEKTRDLLKTENMMTVLGIALVLALASGVVPQVASSGLQKIIESEVAGEPFDLIAGDGGVLAVKVVGEEIQLLDSHGAVAKTIPADGEVRVTALSPDQTRLAVGTTERLQLWNVEAGRLLFALDEYPKEEGGINSLAFSPHGKTLAVGLDKGVVELLEVESGELLGDLEGSGSAIVALSFTPDGEKLVAASDEGVVRLWDLTTGKVQRELQLQMSEVYELAYSPSGKQLAVAGDGLLVWDPLEEGSARWITGGSLRSLCQDLRRLIGNAPSSVYSLAWSPDGRRLASMTERSIEIWDVFSGRRLGKLKGHKNFVSNVVFSSDGDQLISSDRRGGEILIWDLQGF